MMEPPKSGLGVSVGIIVLESRGSATIMGGANNPNADASNIIDDRHDEVKHPSPSCAVCTPDRCAKGNCIAIRNGREKGIK